MSLLINAVESIQIGVEDYRSADERRHLSAVRNVCAGILLLFKEKLRTLSPPHDPELLIKAEIVPSCAADRSVIFVGKGRKTVDVHQIKERFQSLDVDVDWKLFNGIIEIRNDIEHYFTAKSKDAIRESLAKSFMIIRDFVDKELHTEPLELLGPECWNSLLEVAEVFAREEEACRKTMEAIDWTYETLRHCIGHARCPRCTSSLLKTEEDGAYRPDMELQCSSCGSRFPVEEVIESCIEEDLGVEAYRVAKDGGEPPFGRCPECNRETFVIVEGLCLACEQALQYETCQWCETPLSLGDQMLEGLCSYCAYRREKIREE